MLQMPTPDAQSPDESKIPTLDAQSPDEPEERCRFRAQFRKTRLCHFYAVGQCTKGRQCSFAHGKGEVQEAPDLVKTSICKDWSKNQCRLSSKMCPFAHGISELRKTALYAEHNNRSAHGECDDVAGMVYQPVKESIAPDVGPHIISVADVGRQVVIPFMPKKKPEEASCGMCACGEPFASMEHCFCHNCGIPTPIKKGKGSSGKLTQARMGQHNVGTQNMKPFKEQLTSVGMPIAHSDASFGGEERPTGVQSEDFPSFVQADAQPEKFAGKLLPFFILALNDTLPADILAPLLMQAMPTYYED